MKSFIIFFQLVLLLFLFGCNEDPLNTNEDPNIRYFNGDLKVRVDHPEFGPGPNFMVRLYLTPKDFDNRKHYAMETTNIEGIATFTKVRMGECYVDCLVPGDTSLYDSTYTGVYGDTTDITILELKKTE